MESGCGCDPDTVAAVSYEPGVVVNPTMCKGDRIAIKPKNKQLFKKIYIRHSSYQRFESKTS